MVDRTYDGLLPWGYRMRVKPGGDGIVVLDDDGREWTSIRHALFHGRLGFTSRWAIELDVELERLLAYLLTATGLAGEVGMQKSRSDLFESRDAALFYDMWLVAQRLKDGDGHVNEEARAIARMLLATRPLKLEPFHPGVESILYLQGRVEEIDRPAFERGDQDLARLKYAFVRERIGRSAAISLLHRDLNARMPLVRSIWVQTFADERSRDRYFEWMERRLERWNDWGDVAYRKGAPALTRHLFSMLVDEMEERPVAYGHEGAAKPLMAIEYRTP